MIFFDRFSSSTTFSSWQPERMWVLHAITCLRLKVATLPSGGTGFWHETYFMQGGMKGIYDDIEQPIGLMKVAPIVPARGPMFGAAHRVGKQISSEAVIPESELYR
jgi:hypothetical protein